MERELQIIGEATKAILNIDPDVNITSARNIVDLINLIIQSYDTVDSVMIRAIILKDIPILKEKIKNLKLKT